MPNQFLSSAFGAWGSAMGMDVQKVALQLTDLLLWSSILGYSAEVVSVFLGEVYSSSCEWKSHETENQQSIKYEWCSRRTQIRERGYAKQLAWSVQEGQFHTVQACSHFYSESDPSSWVSLNLVQYLITFFQRKNTKEKNVKIGIRPWKALLWMRTQN